MRTLHVDLPGRAYEIRIERGILNRAGAACRSVLPRAVRLALVTDSVVGPLYAARVTRSLEAAGFAVGTFTVPAGESSKSMEQLSRLLEGFMEFGLNRTDAVVALGGGVVGDLAGFAAACALRGVDFVQIPTTLLAQADASVGGKVAVNLQSGKNLAGAFHQPRLVLMDPDVLETLPDQAFADGMAEVIKCGAVFDPDFFAFLEKHPSRREIMAEIESILYICCDLKQKVVVEDERETGARMLLNFGHTLGHAYERAGDYDRWTHGQAVAAGMVKAAQVGQALKVTAPGTDARLASLLGCFGLPLAIDCTRAEYAAAIGLDKKAAAGWISLILLKEPGRAVVKSMEQTRLLGLL